MEKRFKVGDRVRLLDSERSGTFVKEFRDPHFFIGRTEEITKENVRKGVGDAQWVWLLDTNRKPLTLNGDEVKFSGALLEKCED